MLLKQNAATFSEEWFNAMGEGWNQFWFGTASSKPLSLIRIMTGLVLIVWFLSQHADLLRWFGPNSLLPQATVTNLTTSPDFVSYHYTLLAFARTPSEVRIFEYIGIAAAACLAVGLFARVSAAVTLAILLSFVHRVPMISGLAEPVLAPLLFYLVIGPCSEYFSVDAWLARKKSTAEPQPSQLANLTLRMLQVHLAALIFMMGMSKLAQENWWIGDAIWYLLAQTRSRPVNLTSLRGTPMLVNAWTHAIVYFEILFPVLIWNRFARPILLIIAIPIWLSIALATGHVMFALTMITASIAFWQLAGDEKVARQGLA
ncbi:HTTM domain-containing protein [Anatilimnocola floriformis]|uniref:HTTM domain-containing protein n=1 Tax=Anatilimnocola floriformis TaxID=2948575 RepID=UPI0020C47A27|nr:HTTM domain-containing protein [Anatilimnocola floriformis]